jgi:hypothetical protein
MPTDHSQQISANRSIPTPERCVLSLAPPFDLPNKVLVQDSVTNKLSAFAPDLKQKTLGFRADDGDVGQVNDQSVVIKRLACLLPRLLEFCDPWLDQPAFEN